MTATDSAAIVRNYGDPAAEYAAARTAAAVTERGDRAVIRVYGRDPMKMIQGLVSNDVSGAPPDRAVYATVLTPKGKMVGDVRILRDGADLLLETSAAARDGLMAHLRKFVPPLFARFESADAQWGELSVYGPDARVRVGQVLGVTLPEGHAQDDLHRTSFADSTVYVIATAYFDVPGYDLVMQRAVLEDLWQRIIAADVSPAGHATTEVLRVEAGSPRWAAELDENTIPLEAGLRERAISQTKGCYTGQEVIVRILHRGHVNWLLRGVMLGDAPTPAAGTPLLSAGEGRKIGRITSSVWSPRFGQTIALAYVRREVEPGARVRLESDTGPLVDVVALPFAEETTTEG